MGAIGAAAIFICSFFKWRIAVKVAIIAALLEGAIRKWGLPQAQEIVYFLKDIFLAGAYVRFFLFPEPAVRKVNVNGPLMLLLVVGTIVCLTALNPNIASVPAAILGLKIYLYYIPMAFMMPFLFKDEKDLVRQLSWFVLLAIPICLLGTLQFFSPSFSMLNVYAHEAGSVENTVYGVQATNVATFGATDHARITGTFSFISGLVVYLLVVTGLTLSILNSPLARFRVVLLAGVMPLTMANSLMSGSRSAVLGQAIIVATMFIATFFIKTPGKFKASLAVIIGLGATALAMKLFFQDASNAYRQRADNAEARAEMQNRMVQVVTTLEVGYEAGGFTGMGIGVTHPATTALRNFLNQPPPTVRPPPMESEGTQVLIELGVIGFVAWYSLRLGLIYLCFQNIQRSPSPFFKNLNVFLVVFQVLHLVLPFVLNHTAQFLFWALYGITLIPFCTTFSGLRNRRPLPPTGRTVAPANSLPPQQVRLPR